MDLHQRSASTAATRYLSAIVALASVVPVREPFVATYRAHLGDEPIPEIEGAIIRLEAACTVAREYLAEPHAAQLSNIATPTRLEALRASLLTNSRR